ncbi:MAG: hypothetical protein FJZ47_12850 [Candidatus Tectomicrobia bacterium]|uniref:Uncharacterized protein n=1 Tax=Tectimicrobiota bacterium TaxID=2528274 RepID=A0A937W3R1_UNCTE|nr:hypothetical protein [Candidatus Tectomicrobia bacterium]
MEAQPVVYFTIDEASAELFGGVRGKATARIETDAARLRTVVEAQCDHYSGVGDNATRRFLMGMVDAGELVLAVLTPRYLATWGL